MSRLKTFQYSIGMFAPALKKAWSNRGSGVQCYKECEVCGNKFQNRGKVCSKCYNKKTSKGLMSWIKHLLSIS